ncbi:MAG: hypothetical protein ABSH31_14245 [Bryobacteraceae bacterium]|jgi:hypothetical protein
MTEPIEPVAHCYKCGAETKIYHNNVPLCPACAALIKAEAKLELNETL